MKKKASMIVLLLFLLSCSSSSQDLSGVWSIDKTIPENDKRIIELSWGNVVFSKNSNTCIAIDYSSDSPYFYIGGQGRYPIMEVQAISENIYSMIFFFTRGQFDIKCIIHLLSKDSFWIESIEGISLFVTGPERIYYRISGP